MYGNELMVAPPAPRDSDADEYEYFQPFQAELGKANWTAVDNRVIEEFQPLMSAHAFCVLLHIIRMTTGYHTDRVQVSIRQLEDKTGFSRPTVIKAIETLTSPELPCLRVVYPGDRTTAAVYALNTELRYRRLRPGRRKAESAAGGQYRLPPHPQQVVNDIDHGGKGFLPQVVKDIDRSKERIKEKEKEDIYARATPLPEPTQRRGRSERLTGPSQLELEGYSPEPPTAAGRGTAAPPLPEAAYLKRLPGTLERMGLDPARMREMAQLPAGELSVPGIYSGDRGRAFTHGASYPMYLWMLNMLALVCGENLTSGENTALAEPLWRTAREWVDEGRTPPQLWTRFGDPEGYWYASEDHGWKGKRPTVTDVGRKWRAAGEKWARRTAVTPTAVGGGRAVSPTADDGSDGAWATVMKAISRYGRYRQTEMLDALDEITRAAVRAVGLSRLMDVDPDDGRGLRDTRRMFTAEYREQRRRFDARPQTVAQAAD